MKTKKCVLGNDNPYNRLCKNKKRSMDSVPNDRAWKNDLVFQKNRVKVGGNGPSILNAPQHTFY